MIDRATVERIKEAANIVEVVSEFVTLRRSGANYKGLCPFHNEKTPSFIVSPARGTCHCFGCGRGGNAVSFIMEHEQFTYPEALRWLAAKYGIEVVEKEMTDKERQEQSERESMFIINEWASHYFEDLLHNHPDGQTIGMQYFRGRGFRDDIIAAYRLGFDLHDRHALPQQALKEGYKEEFLIKTGLCYKTDRGELIDRFADRVVFPWLGLNGKVVGFSARLLDSRTKGVQQKYVNSPDSEVYHKEKELFGIYQAKKSIAKAERAYIVEGQTDVLSLAQCGIDNVVANSGTALSLHQINILHRLTDNVTLLYDGDEAGIHAALRGTDLLLSEGMNVKVLLLPGGDDPDSFCRQHNASECREYIENNQLDFIQFKTRHLLHHAADPQQRTEAIDSIIRSIAVVPNQVLRDTYLHAAATATGIKEATLINRMNTIIHSQQPGAVASPAPAVTNKPGDSQAMQIEQMIAQLVVQYGEQGVGIIADGEEPEGEVTLAQFIYRNLCADHLELSNPLYQALLRRVAVDMPAGVSAEHYLTTIEDEAMAHEALALAAGKYGRQQPAATTISDEAYSKERDATRRRSQAEQLLTDLRVAYIDERLEDVRKEMAAASGNEERIKELMNEYHRLTDVKKRIADPRRYQQGDDTGGNYRKILMFTLP